MHELDKYYTRMAMLSAILACIISSQMQIINICFQLSLSICYVLDRSPSVPSRNYLLSTIHAVAHLKILQIHDSSVIRLQHLVCVWYIS